MGFALKMGLLVAFSIAALKILAAKALVVSKVALFIAGMVTFRKLVDFATSFGGSDGGWDRNSVQREPQPQLPPQRPYY